jgi:HAD superfamily hydrolase (TIGR01549 family)
MAKIRGVISDLDGTLIDSNDAHAQAWTKALQEFGYEVTFEQIRRFVGMGGDNLLPSAVQVEADSPLGKEIVKRRNAIFRAQYMPTLKAFAQVRALFERIQADGLRVTVATSGEKDDMEKLLKLAKIDDLVKIKVSSADVEKSKPNPDLIHVALERLDCAPEETIMLGDSPYDVEAAGKAGVAVIGLRCGGFSDEDLSGAVALYDDPADLLAHYDTSPLKRSM